MKKGNGEYRIKGNFFSENKILSSVLIGAGVGIALAAILKRDKLGEIKDSILDKSKKAAEDVIADLTKKEEQGFSSFSKSQDVNKENKGMPEPIV